MDGYQREYALFSACGLNCGLCPRYHTEGTSRCPGCAGEGFFTKHPACGVLTCSKKQGVEYCFMCGEYPCKRLVGADEKDSFITHRPQLKDLEKAKKLGMPLYKQELDEKVLLLQQLLGEFNDGRRKNFYCVAVNLLELEDVRAVLKRVCDDVALQKGMTLKEKANLAVAAFAQMGEARGIELKLRK